MGTHVVHAALTTPYIATLIRIRAVRLARQPGFRLAEREDLEQELAAAILKQAEHYDPARGAVTTFIDRVAKTAAGMMARERRRLKRVADRQVISLDRTHVTSQSHRETSLSQYVTVDDLRRRWGGDSTPAERLAAPPVAVGAALAGLAPELRNLALRLAKDGERATAREMGISRRQLRKLIDDLRDALWHAGVRES
jgi:hypothetical protein